MVRARKTRKKDGLDNPQSQTLRVIMGRRIRELRLQKEMTQSDLGATAGITYGHVSLIENGQANITLETLEKISQVLNVSVANLFEYMGHADNKDQIKEIIDLLPGLSPASLQLVHGLVTHLAH